MVTDAEDRVWTRITPELLEGLDEQSSLARAIHDFEPLAFPAGAETAEWLQSAMRERRVPFETHVVQDGPGGPLLGFYAMSPLSFELSRDDYVKLSLRAGRDLGHHPQPGRLLELIARSRASQPGFGKILFTHAIAHALAGRAVALLMQPRPETTQLWRGPRYDCRELEPIPGKPPYDPPVLWHPVWDPVEPEWP